MPPASRYVTYALALLVACGLVAGCGSAPTPTIAPERAITVDVLPTVTDTPVAAATEVPADTPTTAPAATEAPTDEPTATEIPTEAPTVEPTATEIPTPIDTPTLEPDPPTEEAPEVGPMVIIENIHYDGDVPRVESDEYAVIINVGDSAQNLDGWRLNASDEGQDFYFPSYILEAGASCRVYTNEVHPESCGFSFGMGQAIWRNQGECGYLYNASGEVVSEYCY